MYFAIKAGAGILKTRTASPVKALNTCESDFERLPWGSYRTLTSIQGSDTKRRCKEPSGMVYIALCDAVSLDLIQSY